MDESTKAVQAAPLSMYSDEDRDFHAWWYGHMRNDIMQPPLDGIPYGAARYIWDASIDDALRLENAALRIERDVLREQVRALLRLETDRQRVFPVNPWPGTSAT